MSRSLTIDHSTITDDSDCYVIAEIGHNHQGSLEKCRELFRRGQGVRGRRGQAAEARQPLAVHAGDVRQALRQREQLRRRPTASTARRSSSGATSTSSCRRYAGRARASTFFATAFDVPSADFLAELDVPAYKIASGDLQEHCRCCDHVARIGKPMHRQHRRRARSTTCSAPTTRSCRSTRSSASCSARRPIRPSRSEMDLRVISTLREQFPDVRASGSPTTTTASRWRSPPTCSARAIIEKHFTLNRAWRAPTTRFSLEPVGHAEDGARPAPRARGAGRRRQAGRARARRAPIDQDGQEARRRARPARRATSSPPPTSRSSRPGGGLPPYELDRLLGRRLSPGASRRRHDPLRTPARLGRMTAAVGGRRCHPAWRRTCARSVSSCSTSTGCSPTTRCTSPRTGPKPSAAGAATASASTALQRRGIQALILSTEINPVVTARSRKLEVECIQGVRGQARAAAGGGAGARPHAAIRWPTSATTSTTSAASRRCGLPIVVSDAHPVGR